MSELPEKDVKILEILLDRNVTFHIIQVQKCFYYRQRYKDLAEQEAHRKTQLWEREKQEREANKRKNRKPKGPRQDCERVKLRENIPGDVEKTLEQAENSDIDEQRTVVGQFFMFISIIMMFIKQKGNELGKHTKIEHFHERKRKEEEVLRRKEELVLEKKDTIRSDNR